MFWSSSCASNLAALFSSQVCVTLSWSLLLGKKSFGKGPGEQNTLSLGKAGGYTHICIYPQPLPAYQPPLHYKAEELSPALTSCQVSILFPCLALLEVIFCFTHSGLNPNHSQDDKNCDGLLFTLCRFHSKVSRCKGKQGSTGGLSGHNHRAAAGNTKLSSTAHTLLSAVQTLWGYSSSEGMGDRGKMLAR